MCKKEVFTEENFKVRDHNHFIENNNYRGAAHNNCNINCKKPPKIPIIFHNLFGYDIHLFIKALAINNKNKFKVIGMTKEKKNF